MLRCVALVRTDVSEEVRASFIRVTRIGELGKTLAVTSKRRLLQGQHGATSQKTPLCKCIAYYLSQTFRSSKMFKKVTRFPYTRGLIFFLFIYEAAVEPSPLLLRPFIGLLYQLWMIDGDDCGAISGTNEWQGKPEYSEETCRSAALSTTDAT
jgi:hypothetical protein